MSAAPAGRLRLAILVALFSATGFALLVILGSSGAEAGGADLRPDLVTMPISRDDVVLEKAVKRKLLRLSNEVGNRGAGPLEVVPGTEGPPGSCPDGQYEAVQRVFVETNGQAGFQRGGDTDEVVPPNVFGCMRYHAAPGHDHWHVLDFAKYELFRERRGIRVTARKVGFCVIDTERAFPSLVGSPAESFYLSGCGGPGVAPTIEGLSVGWADVYFFGLPGQSLKINHLHRGRYCLVSTADPGNMIEESNEANNQAQVRLKLRPRKLKARVLKGACRLP